MKVARNQSEVFISVLSRIIFLEQEWLLDPVLNLLTSMNMWHQIMQVVRTRDLFELKSKIDCVFRHPVAVALLTGNKALFDKVFILFYTTQTQKEIQLEHVKFRFQSVEDVLAANGVNILEVTDLIKALEN